MSYQPSLWRDLLPRRHPMPVNLDDCTLDELRRQRWMLEGLLRENERAIGRKLGSRRGC